MEENPPRSARRPAGARAASRASAKKAGNVDSASRHALVVEADPATRKLCCGVLESLGFAVDAVDSGVAAVTMARAAPPDLILVDLQLRDVPGVKLMGWLRANSALKTTPIVALSASAEDTARTNGWKVAALLKKPVSAGTVERTIRKVLR
jgi:DNA-binding response OmpR family regulator